MTRIVVSDKILVFKLSTKMLLVNQLAEFFQMQWLKEEVNDEVYFWWPEKHQIFLRVDTIILGVHSQACPKFPN